MKTLFLLRHAKSSWVDTSLSDFERPLNDRGTRAAKFMGALTRERDLVPDLIVCSPATRARGTAELFTEAANFAGELIFDDRIYEASPHRLVEVASEIADQFGSAMLIGHNPGMEGLIRYLAGKLEPMPTAAIAIIDLEMDAWSGIGEDRGTLRAVLRPKALMS